MHTRPFVLIVLLLRCSCSIRFLDAFGILSTTAITRRSQQQQNQQLLRSLPFVSNTRLQASNSNSMESSSSTTTAATTATESSNLPPELLDADDDFLHWFRFGAVGRLYQDDDAAEETSIDDIGDDDDDNNMLLEEEQAQQPEDIILERLKGATVAIVGMGGIGSWAAEALCRSGIGHLVLVDLDDICISSTNRQLHTMSNNVGAMKTEVMKERIMQIQPNCNVSIINDFVMMENVQDIVTNQFQNHYKVNMVIDTIDEDAEKAALVAACTDHGIPILTVGSPAGKSDPTKIVYMDLSQTSQKQDRVLGNVHDRLCKDFGFQQPAVASEGWGIPCVYSQEENKREAAAAAAADANGQSSFRNDGTLGTACFVTGTFGFVAASRVVEKIAKRTLTAPSKA